MSILDKVQMSIKSILGRTQSLAKAGVSRLYLTVQLLGAAIVAIGKWLHSEYSIVTTIATVIMAIYAWQSYKVQDRLANLEEISTSMSTEPNLSGVVIPNQFMETENDKTYYYKLTNIGSDTAWSIFIDLRAMIVTDSDIIYDWAYCLGDLKRLGTYPGDYDYRKHYLLAPGKDTLIGFYFNPQKFVKIARLLKGTLLFEAHLFYWGAVPIVRKESIEYFQIDGNDNYVRDGLRKIDNSEESIRKLIDSHKNNLEIGHITYIDRINRPTFYDDLFGGSKILLLLNQEPDTIGYYFPKSTFRDTLIFTDTAVMDFRQYRRGFALFRMYEKYRDSLKNASLHTKP